MLVCHSDTTALTKHQWHSGFTCLFYSVPDCNLACERSKIFS